MPLYEATLELTIYIHADDPEDARLHAMDGFRDEIDNYLSFNLEVHEATSVLEEWKSAYPYGKETDLTVGELFEHEQELRKQKANYEEYLRRQMRLFSEPQ
jgi:hypothetical protein